MKHNMWGAVALALIVTIAPAAAFAQTYTDGTSPQLHAFFEIEYAREATFLSLTKQHQQSVMALSQSLKLGSISYDAASGEINRLLTPREKESILQVESSFWGALRGMNRSQSASLLVIPQIDPGQFLLFLFDGVHT